MTLLAASTFSSLVETIQTKEYTYMCKWGMTPEGAFLEKETLKKIFRAVCPDAFDAQKVFYALIEQGFMLNEESWLFGAELQYNLMYMFRNIKPRT